MKRFICLILLLMPSAGWAADRVRIGTFAQVAGGGGWTTTITLINFGSVPVDAAIRFYGDEGALLTVPVSFAGFYNADFSFLAVPSPGLQPNATFVVDLGGTALKAGWAEVLATGPLSGYAVVRLQNGDKLSEATVPMDSNIASPTLTIPFDETSGSQTGFALVNESDTATGDYPTGGVEVNVLDESGNFLRQTWIALPARGHVSMFLGSLGAIHTNGTGGSVANHRGLIQIRGRGPATALGMRFNLSGTFTSVPLLRP